MKTTLKQIKSQGRNDGADAVRDMLNVEGIEAVRQTTQPGHLKWDNAARNAGCFEIAFGYDGTQTQIDAYYDAYNAGADEEVQTVLSE